ncbi:MAG: hypothetical protein NTV86_15985 [Planctomycetota bacterium]|nr:hypothetical protein [Planctomycetota bacterium]
MAFRFDANHEFQVRAMTLCQNAGYGPKNLLSGVSKMVDIGKMVSCRFGGW